MEPGWRGNSYMEITRCGSAWDMASLQALVCSPLIPTCTVLSAAALAVGTETASLSVFLAERDLLGSRFHRLSSALLLHPPTWASCHLRCELLAAGPEPCRPYSSPTHNWVVLSLEWCVQGHIPSFEIRPCFKKYFMLYLLLLFLPAREG